MPKYTIKISKQTIEDLNDNDKISQTMIEFINKHVAKAIQFNITDRHGVIQKTNLYTLKDFQRILGNEYIGDVLINGETVPLPDGLRGELQAAFKNSNMINIGGAIELVVWNSDNIEFHYPMSTESKVAIGGAVTAVTAVTAGGTILTLMGKGIIPNVAADNGKLIAGSVLLGLSALAVLIAGIYAAVNKHQENKASSVVEGPAASSTSSSRRSSSSSSSISIG